MKRKMLQTKQPYTSLEEQQILNKLWHQWQLLYTIAAPMAVTIKHSQLDCSRSETDPENIKGSIYLHVQ
jgi:hypothetical protein